MVSCHGRRWKKGGGEWRKADPLTSFCWCFKSNHTAFISYVQYIYTLSTGIHTHRERHAHIDAMHLHPEVKVSHISLLHSLHKALV